MFNPVSTYRIQFHKGFTLRDFKAIIPYLSGLGIKTIYASPIFKAVPGSMHGYDVTGPLQINPEIGTLQELRTISRQLKKAGINWLQDIVPNHMAFDPQNNWLMDVLEKGQTSAYAKFFDIQWDHPVYPGQLMVPFLGKPWGQALADNEIRIIKQAGKFYFSYYAQRYPLNEAAHKQIDDKPLSQVNKDKALLEEIASKQYYRLCFWQETDYQINFRRFFTVNGLICLNMQDEEVFQHYHNFISQLLNEGIFQGLRVDHIDGLYDPKTYLQRLRQLAGPETYIIVEKILEAGESFPVWPVQGNTGYDFLSELNNLFTNTKSRRDFNAFYKDVIGRESRVHQAITTKKRLILNDFMQGELDNLSRMFLTLDPDGNDPSIREAIGEVLVYCPVYRFYENTMPLSAEETTAIEGIFQSIEKHKPGLQDAVSILRQALIERPKQNDSAYNKKAKGFYQRLMQFSGPLMAKGVEDTLMYTYNRFIDHNEVGDSPDAFGLKPDQFQQLMKEHRRLWPLSMNATATHDTKRGEDVRARLNVLSDIPGQWFSKVREWQKMNASLKKQGAPDINDEYFIYQTIAGAYPMPGENEDDFNDRLQQYIEKALREAKVNSGWTTPDETYELAAKEFTKALLDKKGRFWKSFVPFHQTLCDFGIINSLAQVLMKYTCPGVPDLYQGCELWDLSLVDPDNRRAVDYNSRHQFSENITIDWEGSWNKRYNGQIKLQLTRELLKLRNTDTAIFTDGDYIPLKATGKYRYHVFAFARHYKNNWYVTVIPLHTAAISKKADPGTIDWADTHIILPEAVPLNWANCLTGDKGWSAGTIPLKNLFDKLPVALLRLKASKQGRKAGILLHITSLPSAFGTGDMGPEAYAFADFLGAARQSCWQILPLNPTNAGSRFSPYSATSVMAGNTLLISPEKLVEAGWLAVADIEAYKLPQTSKADFRSVTKLKKELFHRAYLNFITNPDKKFTDFKKKESYWLHDFALYEVLKLIHSDKPWYEWAEPYKMREQKTLNKLEHQQVEAIDEVKWMQFVFSEQWTALRNYCNHKGISIIGDMPFYASYDSADVWAYPELFKIDAQGTIEGIAGVPPDYFSSTGQLWGMPVYNWDAIEELGYDWWIKRIQKNLEYVDLLRLDHFRAFSAFWEVPGGSGDAINGKWLKGPGEGFFSILQKQLGRLPLIAEDLGQIDAAVYELRDKFNLPGMRVLQFAFDEAMPVSDHIPHNYMPNSYAYTGTHDNDTMIGWFSAADKGTQQRVASYLGKKVNAKVIAAEMIGSCYASVARTVIIPLQDIIGLGTEARMNIPAAAEGNWSWRLKAGQLKASRAHYLAALVIQYNR